MSSIGTGYDLSASQFSPDGRVFQVEYAAKAVENSGTVIGLRGKDGVVFAVEKLVTSKLYEPGANKRIFHADQHVGIAVAGLISDARQIVETARNEASSYRNQYGIPVPLKYLKDRVSMYMHAYTLYSAVRPYGCSVVMGTWSEHGGPEMYMLDPSGVSFSYFGCAVGKAKQAAKTEIEKLKLADMTVKELVKEAARIVYLVHDELKDKQFELELSWVCKSTKGKHEMVPREIAAEAENTAKQSLADIEDSDEGDIGFPESTVTERSFPAETALKFTALSRCFVKNNLGTFIFTNRGSNKYLVLIRDEQMFVWHHLPLEQHKRRKSEATYRIADEHLRSIQIETEA